MLPCYSHMVILKHADGAIVALGADMVTDSTTTATPTGTVTTPVTPGVTPIPTETPPPLLQWQMYGREFKKP